ncbi:UBP1-associated protein 2C-like protein [Tanacetum coccineum]
MDPSKKRKTEDNGLTITTTTTPLTPSDARKILETLTKDQLLNILQPVLVRDSAVLDAVRAIADADPTQRKLFIRGIGWETTSEKLRTVFSAYGELEEAIVITDKVTNKSKGYGFVTFKHIDGAMLAVKEPSKKIDGRVTVAQFGGQYSVSDSCRVHFSHDAQPHHLSNSVVHRKLGSVDVSMRKIYVGNAPFEISSERLLAHFVTYKEIEEGPLGFNKQSGKVKGFAFFVYKSEERARNSLVDPIKVIDGHQVNCKMAMDGKKKLGGGVQGSSGFVVHFYNITAFDFD